jgi:hypothetical protein
MKRNRNDTSQAPAEPQLAEHRWMPNQPLPPVGLDPAIWSQRVRQVALWRLLETWDSGRRLH